ncbi:putative disease resistance protein RGA1 isoform X2 [Trifolium pratense]|uniref:putative disease resistance protein RGA1 isoform X2 n=1 Tax=Trifolium pratense TaxID=57577 RepID=UPI001E694921|nr:putative disease resistance protein RGA1 isoform X2 [Trifolium pratense]XP_045813819.1 putative disease resistance protein RGA1 isoform X2 [Trifolium pratense]
MAEAVIEIVLGSLSSLAQNEIGLFLGFDQEFEKISSLLTTIKATLEDAEEKQFTDKAIQNWLQKLKDAAHVLDDILDECATKALELKYKGFKHGLSLLSSLNPKHVAFRYKVAKKMKSIMERLDQIAEERSKFHLPETARERRTGVPDRRQTTSTITQPQVYGRDEDVKKIADFLVGPAADSDDLSVYPIVGLGGLGKTTLAQSIFNHDRVVKHFELRSWVCVSEDFSLKRMTKSIIESISGHTCEDLELDPLQRKLHDLLYRKKYLLVLDDVWDEEQENWQKLKSILACGGKGASVIVTTRLLKVATIMGTMTPYELSMLSDNDCWELFKQRAFGANEEELTELVVIGKEIVQKCGGVPLATIALGSLLRFKRDKKEWLYIKESKLWSLQGENVVMPALRLSYLNLPIKLRQCFALCALFPKDYIINKQFVIELWIANGFISSNEMLDAEDIGNDVWNELYWRSFFQDIRKDEFFGNVLSFKMHDLVHDLAQSVTEDVYCITGDNGAPTSKRIRHISMCGWNAFKDVIRFPNIESLKTCITPDDYSNVDQLLPNILKCYSLRVLDYHYKGNLSSSIGHLRYLRYLNLSCGRFKTLPKSLCELWNLQILKLDHCLKLQNLPNNLTRLEALQHLSLNDCSSLSSLPSNISKLTSLRTLTMYIVGNKRGSYLAELAQLNLKGELHLKHLERVKNVTDSKEANMSRKYVNHLRLSWDRNEESELQENVEQIAEMLQPHAQQLQLLGVEGYRGEHFPQWMSSPSLKDLELTDCKNCLYLKEESSNGGIAGGFIALENLLLNKMSKLISFSRDQVAENMFTCLSKLKIIGCPNLLGLPFLPALKKLSVRGNCSWELLSSIHKLHNLESLYLEDNEEVSCFPDNMLSNLTSLKELMIRNHSKLKLLPIETINPCVLWSLSIENCENLESLKDEALQGLHSLLYLEILKCPKFNLSAGFGYLTCLKGLRIGNFSDMSGFSEALQHMTALRILELSELPNLTSLPDCLGNLGLLRALSIEECPNLMCLPTTIQRLSGLQTLDIQACHPELANRCKKETGEDWPKIAHVEYLSINEYV